jgi:RimJ/RimL family protein N-acetyltransferase
MEGFRPPVSLTGRWIRLVPLSLDHAPALRAAARDPEVRRYLLHGPGETLEELRSTIAYRLELQKAGTDLPFTTVLRMTDRPVGMTGFKRIDRVNQSVEVGGTWLDSALWRTPVNTESKYLLFRYAFETGKVHRVTLQTDLRNERSQRAIARLGAVREATFRDDQRREDGSYRSSVYYGVLVSEWPRVRDGLEAMLAREWKTPPEITPPPATGPSPKTEGR